MTQFTPEEIRDAAAVVRAYGAPPHIRTQSETETLFRTARILDDIATRTEREQAEQAQRKKRIEQLAAELWTIAGGYGPLAQSGHRDFHLDVARKLIERYPALAMSAQLSDCTCLADTTVSNYCALHGDPTNPGGDCK